MTDSTTGEIRDARVESDACTLPGVTDSGYNARAAMIARIATGEVDEARPDDGDDSAAVGQFARPEAPLLQDRQTISV